MSRFYNLIVTPVSDAGVVGTPVTWTNKNGNKAVMSAQRIEFDLCVTTGATPAGGAWIRVWGPTKEQIQQASDFNGANIEFYGGMQAGLPLATQAANAGQAGLLIKGSVFQAFANWQGTVQTLEFVIQPSATATAATTTAGRQAVAAGAPIPPQNFSFLWKQGSSLIDNVAAVLQIAYPGATVTNRATSGLALLHDESAVYTGLGTFASFVAGISRDIKGPGYNGLNVTSSGTNAFLIYDNTQDTGKSVAITMLDLIGQVTWLSPAAVSFAAVLRADLTIGDIVTFPPLAQAQAITTASSASQARNKNTFNGTWMVAGNGENGYVRHVGDSRAPNAEAWVSTYQAVAMDIGT